MLLKIVANGELLSKKIPLPTGTVQNKQLEQAQGHGIRQIKMSDEEIGNMQIRFLLVFEYVVNFSWLKMVTNEANCELHK